MQVRSRQPLEDLAVAVLFLCLAAACAMFGGANRMDVTVVAIVRVLAVATGAAALVLVPSVRLAVVKAPLLWLGLLAGYILLQLVPLPPFLWHSLPGHALIAAADQATGVGDVWRPITISPVRSWNSLMATLVPFAALLLLAGLTRAQRTVPLWTMVAIGLMSGILGLLQIVGPPDGPLYFYDITNAGSAVGFFANRNHQAALLVALFPMLGAVAALPNAGGRRLSRAVLAAIAALFVIPLLLVTGSRAGLLLMPLGLVAGLVIARPMLRELPRRRALAGAAAALLLIVAVVVAVVLQARAQALTRLLDTQGTGELRYEVIAPIWNMSLAFMPFGSGFGTFDPAFRMFEPHELLKFSYLNHAHSDPLELLSDGGIFGVAIFLGFFIWWCRAVYRAWRAKGDEPAVILARTGSAVSAAFLLASLGDYPLRAPLAALTFAVAVYWLAANQPGSVRRNTHE